MPRSAAGAAEAKAGLRRSAPPIDPDHKATAEEFRARAERSTSKSYVPAPEPSSTGLVAPRVAPPTHLLGPAGQRLAALGITVQWSVDLVAASGLGKQVVASQTSSGPAAFGFAGEADLTWQISLDGEPLSDEETAAAAEAVAGVLRIRGRWVVIDDETRRLAGDRRAGRLTAVQAVGATLTGQVTAGRREVAWPLPGGSPTSWSRCGRPLPVHPTPVRCPTGFGPPWVSTSTSPCDGWCICPRWVRGFARRRHGSG